MTNWDNALPVILGAGGAGFLTAVGAVVRSWRDGVEQSEARAIKNLERWRIDADNRANREEKRANILQRLLDRERRYVAILEYTLIRAGIALPKRERITDESESDAKA